MLKVPLAKMHCMYIIICRFGFDQSGENHIISYVHTVLNQLLSISRFIRSAKVSDIYFSMAILTEATLTLMLHVLILVC